MRFELHIELGYEAMREPAHIAAALRKVSDRVEQLGVTEKSTINGLSVRDENGNHVGDWKVSA